MENKDDYAIVVGINSYVQLRKLQGAHKDATEFAKWLTSEAGGGLPVKNLRLILSPETLPSDPFKAEPVKLDIDKALRDFGIEKNIRIGRRLYFYFAGHGFGPTFDDVGMLMASASMKRLKLNMGLRLYQVFFHDHPMFDELVFILDCCRDPFYGVETAGPDFTLDPWPNLPVEDFVVLAASYGAKAFELSDELAGERRGVLTKVLLNGLNSLEAADSRGFITAYSLRKYLHENISKTMIDDDKLKQQPETPRLPRKSMVFRKFNNSDLKRITVQVVVPNGLQGELIIKDSAMEEIDRYTITDSLWEIELIANRWYAISHTENTPNIPPKILDLNNINIDPYVFQY